MSAWVATTARPGSTRSPPAAGRSHERGLRDGPGSPPLTRERVEVSPPPRRRRGGHRRRPGGRDPAAAPAVSVSSEHPLRAAGEGRLDRPELPDARNAQSMRSPTSSTTPSTWPPRTMR
ncbi:hypothetical protein HBB16_01885 [Pseudonocardia sp. MCCB 268]|nr:hypothetical protein [Pseudonocardia cytotoxica]